MSAHHLRIEATPTEPGVVLIPKAASQALSSLFGLIQHRIDFGAPHVAFLRDPIERLSSFWRFIQDCGYRKEKNTIPRDYKALVDWVLENEDRHTIPQSQYCEDFTNLTLYRFEDLSAAFPGISRVNGSIPRENLDIDYRIADLRAYYKEDLAWRHTATKLSQTIPITPITFRTKHAAF